MKPHSYGNKIGPHLATVLKGPEYMALPAGLRTQDDIMEPIKW